MAIVIFDLDGTLALIDHRRHLVECDKPDWPAFFAACDEDQPNVPVIEIFEALKAEGHTMWIWSGRSDEVERDTVSWLMFECIEFDRLMMRPEGDFTPDDELKKSWLKKYFPINKDNLLCVFDDRDKVVKMWRDEGITCLQVAPGDF